MIFRKIRASSLSISILIIFVFSCSNSPQITFQQKKDHLDIFVKDKLFTSYQYTPEFTKPILYPVFSPSGVELTRGFPFKTIEGESRDHPHHTGIFFTYDDVNQDGFWNNTTSPPQIKHVRFENLNEGKNSSAFSTLSNWIGKSGKTLLVEKRKMTFSTSKGLIFINFDIQLTAKDTTVIFHDTKEGMLGMRVADWFREDQTGHYLSSNGDETEKNIWGKRASWVRLEGEKNNKKIGIVIINHPGSVNYPTFWHARGYGLFAANPLGQSVFQKTRKEKFSTELNFTLKPDETGLFKFQMIFYEGERSKEEIDKWFDAYQKSD